jgi:hypothetical protein
MSADNWISFVLQADRPLLLLLDSVFSVTVIGTLVIFEWRGIWVLLDLLLFPEHPSMNITICIVFGYGICFIVDTLQNRTVALSAHLDSKKLWLLRLAFEDVYLFMAKLGVIALWHGLWVFCESVVTDREGPNELVRVWIPITIGYLVPTLLLHANSIFVLEVVLDGGLADGIGCRVRVTMLENYLKVILRERESLRSAKLLIFSFSAFCQKSKFWKFLNPIRQRKTWRLKQQSRSIEH